MSNETSTFDCHTEPDEPLLCAEDRGDCMVEDDDEEEDDEYEYEYEDDELRYEQVEEYIPPATESTNDLSREAVQMSLRTEKETQPGKRRLASDLFSIMKSKASGIAVEALREDDMSVWKLELSDFDEDSNLAKDMRVLNVSAIELEMTFPDDYPFQPPFCRIVRPRFKGGFVIGGAICMELLTSDGWNPVNDIEAVLVSIRSHLVVGDGRLEAALHMDSKEYSSRLEGRDTNPLHVSLGSYTEAQARDGFKSLTSIHDKHGWSNSWVKKG